MIQWTSLHTSDNLGIHALARPVTKWYLAWPRWLAV